MSGGRVLVTGGTGFVGRQVMACLAAADHPVRAVVRTGSADRLPRADRAEVVESDDLFAQDAAWWAGTCEGIEAVVHLAWVATGPYLTAPENLACLSGTLALAHGAVAAGVRRFVGTGTCVEYDLGHGILSVDTPLRPTTPYGGAKAAAFQALSQWLPANGVSFLWCRLFHVHGAGEDPRRLVGYLRRQMAAGEKAELTSGNQIRDFIEVADCAARIIAILDADVEGPFNLCNGVPVTVRQFAERLAVEHGRPADLLAFGARPDRPGDPYCILGVPGQGRILTGDKPVANAPLSHHEVIRA